MLLALFLRAALQGQDEQSSLREVRDLSILLCTVVVNRQSYCLSATYSNAIMRLPESS